MEKNWFRSGLTLILLWSGFNSSPALASTNARCEQSHQGRAEPRLSLSRSDLPKANEILPNLIQILSQITPEQAKSIFAKGFWWELGSRYQVPSDIENLDWSLSNQNILKGQKRPTAIWVQSGAVGDQLVIYQGNLYWEGYFRSQRTLAKENMRRDVADLIQQQPWFEWDPQSRTYSVHTTGVQRKLIESDLIKDQLLYRGLPGSDAKLFLTLKILFHGMKTHESQNQLITIAEGLISDFASDPKLKIELRNLKRLVSGRSLLTMEKSNEIADQILEAYYQYSIRNKRNALFFTPSLKIASRWAKPLVLKTELTFDQLIEFSDQGGIYVGIEGDSPEVAFYSRDSWKKMIENSSFDSYVERNGKGDLAPFKLLEEIAR